MSSQTYMPPRACQSSRSCGGHRQLATRLSLPRAPQSVAALRHQIRELMRRWDLEDIADDAELLVSELAANAVQHATGLHYTVAVTASAGRILIEVFDSELRLPVVREPDIGRESGRGLTTLAALAKDWGAVACPSGKCVWFTLQLPPCTA